MKLISIIYSSLATTPFSEDDLVSVLNQSRANNLVHGITGLLLYKDGEFLQVLEGQERTVEKVYATIEKDPRHRACFQLRWEVMRERRFPDWSMGFKNLRNIEILETPGYSQFMNDPLSAPSFRTDPSRATKLLLLFRENP